MMKIASSNRISFSKQRCCILGGLFTLNKMCIDLVLQLAGGVLKEGIMPISHCDFFALIQQTTKSHDGSRTLKMDRGRICTSLSRQPRIEAMVLIYTIHL